MKLLKLKQKQKKEEKIWIIKNKLINKLQIIMINQKEIELKII